MSRSSFLRANRPKLDRIGLGWMTFSVVRRSGARLMRQQMDPKLIADQMGNTVDVNENIYQSTTLQERRAGLNRVELLR